MNVLYTGAYFVSLLSLIIVMRGIFGFSFSTRIRDLICGAVLVLAGAIVTLLLPDPSDRVLLFPFVEIFFCCHLSAWKKESACRSVVFGAFYSAEC